MSSTPTLSTSAERAGALLGALRECRADIAHLLASLLPQDLALPTVCTGWSIRDEIGHIIEATEMLTRGLEQANTGVHEGTFRPQMMAAEMETSAVKRVALMPLPQIMLTFSEAADQLLHVLEQRDPANWDEEVAHPYLGNCPAVQFAGFALLDWFIHPWDIQEALGLKPEPNPSHAALLVPGLVGLLPKRLDTKKSRGWRGRFRFLVENPGNPDEYLAQIDVVLNNNAATVERNVSNDVLADLTFKGQPGALALGMLGRRGMTKLSLPAPTNETWLPRWGSLWISL